MSDAEIWITTHEALNEGDAQGRNEQYAGGEVSTALSSAEHALCAELGLVNADGYCLMLETRFEKLLVQADRGLVRLAVVLHHDLMERAEHLAASRCACCHGPCETGDKEPEELQ